MSRYIDADKVLDGLAEERYMNTNDYVTAVRVIGKTPTADVRENVKAEWEFTDHAYTVYCKRCRYKHNRASQYCPECGA